MIFVIFNAVSDVLDRLVIEFIGTSKSLPSISSLSRTHRLPFSFDGVDFLFLQAIESFVISADFPLSEFLLFNSTFKLFNGVLGSVD